MRLLLSLAALVGAVGAAAQPAAPSTPFVEVVGEVRADSLVVVRAGTVAIRLHGADPARDEARTNLPDRLRDGEAYRDVRYRFRLAVSPLLRTLLPADSLLQTPRPRPPSPSPR